MSVVNNVNLIGIVGHIETKSIARKDGSSITKADLSLGLMKTKKDEKTAWIPVVAWGTLADIMGKYLTKSKKVAISGELRLDVWETEDGSKRSKMYVVADPNGMQMLDSKGDAPASASDSDDEFALPPDDEDVPF